MKINYILSFNFDSSLCPLAAGWMLHQTDARMEREWKSDVLLMIDDYLNFLNKRAKCIFHFVHFSCSHRSRAIGLAVIVRLLYWPIHIRFHLNFHSFHALTLLHPVQLLCAFNEQPNKWKRIHSDVLINLRVKNFISFPLDFRFSFSSLIFFIIALALPFSFYLSVVVSNRNFNSEWRGNEKKDASIFIS